jgi:glycosyltransferase involved in cell wall biosynthesis
MRRVLYVNHTSQVSGGERSLLLLLSQLPEDAILPVLACPDGPLAAAARTAGVAWAPITGTDGSLKLHPRYTAEALRDVRRAAAEVRRRCDELGIDLVHANSIRAGLIAALARRRSGPPSVAHLRDVLPAGVVPASTVLVLDRNVDAVIANSRYTLDHMPWRFRRAAAAVVHNPVDLRRFDRAGVDPGALRRELKLGADVRLLTVVAQVTPWKGQDTAIHALAGLRERGHDVHLALAGSAKFLAKETRYDNAAYLDELRALIGELGVAEHVTFLGERDDVPAVMAAADVLLMPSWEEPFGRSVIESMAIGTAVAATAVGGTAEIVTDDVDGLLVPPREPAAWVDALDRLLRDDVLRERIAAAGRARARAFASERHVEQVLQVYARVAPATASAPVPA